MKCDKCGLDFEEKDIDLSHDIPKYMGGEDKDGRHYLCKECHKKYESEVLRLSIMDFISNSSLHIKRNCQKMAKIVGRYFFKNKGEEDGNSI